jgi:branched-chain amino acid aminotransferase
MNPQISITKTTHPKTKPDPDTLRFGDVFTDHMFIMDYKEGKGWYDPRIVPYGPLELDPAAVVFHYAQEMFEGLKTYLTKDGDVQLFRPDMNAKRTTRTNERLCIPKIDEDFYVEAIKALVEVDKDWVPNKKDTSLYIRPFIIATEPFIGVRSSNEYKFIIILSPVGPYYPEGLKPTKIYVEDKYVRAVVGGTGEAKIGGNYATGLKAQEEAAAKGFSQVLWLDGKERKYVEEIGTSNAFFVIDGEAVTSPLTGTILPGITRDSVIQVLKDWGVKVREEKTSIDDIFKAFDEGRLTEVFATGTAAVISPVGELKWGDRDMVINNNQIGDISQRLYDTITGIQSGELPDEYNWVVKL